MEKVSGYLALAERYVAATARANVATLEALHEPGAVVWHNFDEAEQSLERSLKTLAWLFRIVPDLRLDEVVVLPTNEGFVLRWVMAGTAPGGGAFRVPSCLVATVSSNGLIARIEEYIDSAQAAVFAS